jgi:energy-coupling factor transport system ATP-binding protein
MTSSPLIAVEHLTVAYPNAERPALRDVSLVVQSGETLALIGPNGAGKSTLARHLAGLRRPTGGRIVIDGRDVATEPTGAFASLVGIVFQNPDAHLTEPSVLAELTLGPRRLGLPLDTCTARAERVLEQLNLHGQEYRHPMLLDLAHRRLVALGSALTLCPPVLLLDEPTVGLDADTTAIIAGVIEQRQQSGTTTIVISHDLDFVAERTSRAVLLNDGRVLRDDRTDRILSDAPTLAAAGLDLPEAARLATDFGLVTPEQPIVTAAQLTAAILAQISARSSAGGA